MTPMDLVTSTEHPVVDGSPEYDVLRVIDGLQEAALASVYFDVMNSTAGLLLDLRMAIQLRIGNVGVLVARGVHTMSWVDTFETRDEGRFWHAVVSSSIVLHEGFLTVRLGCASNASISFDCKQATFCAGEIRDLKEAPPDFVEDDEAYVQTQLPTWSTQMSLIWSSSITS